MARPKVTHDGFLVPNAATVSNPRMAEPDQVDFNIGAHALWGVVDGCLVTVAGSTASTLGGTVIINGVMLALANSTAQLGVGGAQDRFDLLVADISGVLKVIPGAPSVDPVFPDPASTCTVLAAVFCPAGLASFNDNVIDKRKFIHKALLSKIAADDLLVRNLNGSGDMFSIRGDGVTWWGDDTSLYRYDASRLRVHKRLWVEEDIAAGGIALSPGGVVAEGTITGSNLLVGATPPATAANGTIFQADDGRLYIRKNNAWLEMATVNGTVPMGTIISNLRPKAEMLALGWVALDGSSLSESGSFNALFNLFVSLGVPTTGSAPNRSLNVPDATGRVLVHSASVGLLGGPVNNQIALTLAQMPKHKHNVRTQQGGGASPAASTGRAGTHAHAVTGGAHSHPLIDPGHAHNGMDLVGNASPVISLCWGGNNKIDALFNDRNHTYSVEAFYWTMPAFTNISIGSSGSEHPHTLSYEGDHDHSISISPIAAHTHTTAEDEIGSNAPIDITPMHLTVTNYIRS